MSLLHKFPVSMINVVTLALLSVAVTDVFQENLFMYAILFLIITISNFTLETAFNRAEADPQAKAKKVGLITVPSNLALFVVFMLVAFV